MIKMISNAVRNIYQQYELITCIYMFEPWEKRLINGFVVFLMSLVIFSSWVYLPAYIETFLQFISPSSTNGRTVSTAAASTLTPVLQPEKILS